MRRPLTLALLPLALLALPSDASAVGTRTFELNSLDDLSGGDLEGASVDSRGRVRAGFQLGALAIGEANAISSALVMPDGGVLLGTGNTGKLIRVSGGQATTLADTGEIAVTSLALGFSGAAFAGTLPSGKVFRLDGQGKLAPFADLPGAEGVFALVFDKKQNALFAATGPTGKIFRIDANGKAQVYFESDEAHIVSLALASDGSLYAGSSGKALLYRLTGPGRAEVVMDFPGDDVKAIAIGRDGSVFAISNEYADPPELPKRPPSTTAAPVNLPRPKPGKGALTRIDPEGRAERLLYRADTHFVSLALDDDDRPHVGTGAFGRVYSADESLTTMLVADTSERQIGAMVLSGKTRFLATSDPPVYREVRGSGGAEAVFTSKVLDAGARAHFGTLRWDATGPIEVSTRSGNTEIPDKTWSAWSPALTSQGKVTSPSARFVQVRARFSRDPKAALSDISLAFVTDNLRAVVTEVEARPKNAPASKARTDGIPASGGEPPSASTIIKLSWKVSNPDSDPLRYRLAYQPVGQSVFRDITSADEKLTKTEYEWDTSGLAEGRYRVRVEASDELANPPNLVLRHALESQPVTVDNTPPVFRSLSVSGKKIVGEATDGVGPIARIEVSVDGRQEWLPFAPKDGLFDDATEAFEIELSDLPGGGGKDVAVRVYDAAGNFVVRSLGIK